MPNNIIEDKERKIFRFRFTDYNGKRKMMTGFSYSRKADRSTALRKTEAMARELKKEHLEIRRGIRPRPNQSEAMLKASYRTVVERYLKWGKKQGGKKGRPWAKNHAYKVERMLLVRWPDRLKLETMSDLVGSHSDVEGVMLQLMDKRTPKTAWMYVEALKAFCGWCVDRDHLPENPLAKVKKPNTDPRTIRRALTLEEVQTLLKVAPIDRQLLYETAICSGLRANELRQLNMSHLDVDEGGLKLEPEWTKNRKPGFQPLPPRLVARLYEFALSGEPRDLYEKNVTRAETLSELPERPLLYVRNQNDRTLRIDLAEAEIEFDTDEGKLDFHALRTTFVTLLHEMGGVTS